MREHHVATSLGALGAPVAEPLGGTGPIRSPSSGFVVTLWRRLERDPAAQVSGKTVGHSLRQLHEALAALGTSPRLPDFRLWLLRARDALSDDDRMSALADGDVAFLRDAFDALLAQLADRPFARRRLHGGPHDGNYLRTPAGIRWVDLECVSEGRSPTSTTSYWPCSPR